MQLVQTYPQTDLSSTQVRLCCPHRNLREEINRENCPGSCSFWKNNEFLRNFFKAFREAALIKILSQKLLSSFLVYIPASEIQENNELPPVIRFWARTQRVYPGVQCQVLACTMSLFRPCRIKRDL